VLILQAPPRLPVSRGGAAHELCSVWGSRFCSRTSLPPYVQTREPARTSHDSVTGLPTERSHGGSRPSSLRTLEPTPGYWDPASASWRICPTPFESVSGQ
jgi:hypothetical protein